jgi:hypothetical protein
MPGKVYYDKMVHLYKTRAYSTSASLFVVHLVVRKTLITKQKILVGGTGLEPVTSSV